MEDTEAATAYHEAGHVLVGHVLGREIAFVSIRQHPGGNGMTLFVDRTDRAALRADATVRVAGPHAERRHRGEANPEGATHDLQGAVEDIAKSLRASGEAVTETAIYERLQSHINEAVRLVDEYWEVIESFVPMLLKEKQLEGHEATAFLERLFTERPRGHCRRNVFH